MIRESPTSPDVGHSGTEPWLGLGWRRLVSVSGVSATMGTTAAALYLTDIEGAVVALSFGVSTWMFITGRRKTGAILLLLVSGITTFFMTTAALTNTRGWGGIEGMVLAGGLSAVATLASLASIGWLIRRDGRSTFGPWIVVGYVLFSLAQPAFRGFPPTQEAGPADIELLAENVAFSEDALVWSAGEVTVSLENRDLFWHTFSIEELDVDLKVPVAATMAVTFDAPPGEYRFFCAVPGHTEAGMEGTLTVEG